MYEERFFSNIHSSLWIVADPTGPKPGEYPQQQNHELPTSYLYQT